MTATTIAAPSVRAQSPDEDGLTISGALRLRYELLEGQYRPGLPPRDDGLFVQTEVAADYRTGPWHLTAELVDARGYWIDAPGASGTGEVNALELSRASVGYRDGPVELTAGRLHLDLGSRRLSARNAFRNTINSFTGLRLEWHGQNHDTLTAFYVLPHSRLPNDGADLIDNRVRWDRESFDLAFWGGHYSRPDLFGGITLQANIFGLNERDGDNGETRNRQLLTAGARLHRPAAAHALDLDIEAAWQIGSIRSTTAANAPRQNVRAYLLHAEAGYTFAGALKPRLSVLIDIASGDDPHSGNYTRFDTLYGARRGDFGPTGLFGALARTNIISPGVRFEAKPAPRWQVAALWRPSWLHDRRDRFGNSDLVDLGGRSGRFTGHMIELRIGHTLIEDTLRFEAGTAVLANSSLGERAPNAPGFGDTRYAYGQMVLEF